LAVQNHRCVRPRMVGIRFPQVKEEGRRFFGPGDMEGIGYPPSVARGAYACGFDVPRKTLSVTEH